MTLPEMKIIPVCLLLILRFTAAQQNLECPSDRDWVKFQDKCYKFYSYPRVDADQAAEACRNDGAELISVNTEQEHQFVDRYLRQEDIKRNTWLTSGVIQINGDVKWGGDGSTSSYLQFNKFSEEHMNRLGGIENFAGKPVTYVYQTTEYIWFFGASAGKYAFICEINIEEVYKIVEQFRDFDYGLNVENADRAPRGPTFDLEPEDTVILGDTDAVHFDCVAKGLPEPRYEWQYASQDNQPFITIQPSARKTFTTGRMTIIDPRETKNDAGLYRCVAINDQGTVLSSPMKLEFGDLGQFSNIAPAPVQGREYSGAQLVCPTITGSPAISYQWYKDTFASFIRPDFQKHTFISKSGKLLFSELASSDAAMYYCVATLTSFGKPGNYAGAYQSKSRTSKGFQLYVNSGTGSNYEPDIQNGFIFIYPPTPMRGAPVQLECFAYGTLELRYTWRRVRDSRGNVDPTGALPLGHKLSSNDRILTLRSVSLEDSGEYRCTVFGLRTAITKTTIAKLIIQSKPFFTYDLSHQHKDVSSKLVWQCEASGLPKVEYSWYKNGKMISSSTAEGRTVTSNTLIIDSLEKERDSGMYQCGATNIHGTAYSTAQLRVLEIAPSFDKRPMARSMTSALQSNMTLVCDPAAAPAPQYTWIKDGSPLALTAGQYHDDDHYKLLLNGNLMISLVNRGDQGTYTCRVENTLGQAEDSTRLITMESTSIITPPSDATVDVNFTVTILCQATKPNNIDMIYHWRFNDHVIDYRRQPEYRQGSGRSAGYLYVQPAKFKNAGRYTCTATTGMDSKSAHMYLIVRGPPSEPAGVHVRDQSLVATTDTNVVPSTTRWVTWVDGDANRSPITAYLIEFKTDYDTDWRVYGEAMNHETVHELVLEQHFYQVENLKAGVGIQFRVRARNVYGFGPPSLPTKTVQIDGIEPTETVENIRGGHGSVGDMVVLWDPLPLVDHNAPNLRYIVYYRPYDPNNRDEDLTNWQSSDELPHRSTCFTTPDYTGNHLYVYLCKFVHLVGSLQYFRPYETKIQTINDKGSGPISDATIIMSAEELPLQAPTEIYADPYNATALMVRWKSIPNTRESARGVLAGYKINYWHKYKDKESDARQNIIELPEGSNNLDHGLIIGLNATDWYEFNVQAYNSAGNGPKSSDYEQQTRNKIPSQYPTEVHVYSVDGLGVRVTFRGISTQIREEPLQGYKVQVWELQENILAAREVDFGKMPTGVIRNLTSSKIYNLRVYGYSRAGQGKRSSPAVTFTVGEGQIQINQETMEIMNGASVTAVSVALVTVMNIVLFYFNHR